MFFRVSRQAGRALWLTPPFHRKTPVSWPSRVAIPDAFAPGVATFSTVSRAKKLWATRPTVAAQKEGAGLGSLKSPCVAFTAPASGLHFPSLPLGLTPLQNCQLPSLNDCPVLPGAPGGDGWRRFLAPGGVAVVHFSPGLFAGVS